MRYSCLLLCCLFATLLPAQTPIQVGRGGMQTSVAEANTGADLFATGFDESDVGFLHVYVDPNPDPLSDYLFRGVELSDTALTMMPARLRKLAKDEDATFYGTMAIHGIDENLYITRLDAPRRDQIDMFAIRDGRVVHLKTLAYLDCAGTECLQMDSYITDLNLDTRFDLVQIARRVADGNRTTDERRTVYTMPIADRRWEVTEELDVPWEGITFYEKGMPADTRRQ